MKTTTTGKLVYRCLSSMSQSLEPALSCCPALWFRKQENAQPASGLSYHRLNNSVCPGHTVHAYTPPICPRELSPPDTWYDYLMYVFFSGSCTKPRFSSSGILATGWPLTVPFNSSTVPLESLTSVLCSLGQTLVSLAVSCWSLPLDFPFVLLSEVPFSHHHLLFSSLKQCMAYLLGIHLTMDLKNISLLWE